MSKNRAIYASAACSLVVILCLGADKPETKAEAELRVRLGQLQVALDQATKDRAALSTHVVQLSSGTSATARAAAAALKNAANDQLFYATEAAARAAEVQRTVENNAAVARQAERTAASNAALAAATARSQNLTLILVQICSLMAIIMKFVYDGWVRTKDHEWAQQTAALQEAKISQIHALVNSNMTAAMENELDARRSNLVLLEEAVGMRKLAGAEPSTDALATISATKIKIGELSSQLNDRAIQTNAATKQLELDMRSLKRPSVN